MLGQHYSQYWELLYTQETSTFVDVTSCIISGIFLIFLVLLRRSVRAAE